jgi:hypothetical protein
MASPPAPEKPKSEIDHRLAFKRIDAFVTVSKTLIQWVGLVTCMFFVYRCVAVLAGKETFATLGMSILGNLHVSDGIYIVLSGGSLIYGIGQRSLRRRNIQRLTPRSVELEKRLDPNRTSSSLTSKGTTRPEDKT